MSIMYQHTPWILWSAILISLICCSLICPSPSSQSKIEVLNFNSEIFDNERRLHVYLPSGYDGIKSYKVLYLNDGQHVFGDHDFGALHDWRVGIIADSLIKKSLIEPIIIVGIDHLGKRQRAEEYLPWEDEYLSPPVSNPKGKQYPDFLVEEVMPFIEANFQVKKGKKHTGVGGFSYGGLMATYTAMMKPSYFDYMLIESPSFYVNNQQILIEAEQISKEWPTNVYMGIGTNELGFDDCDEEQEDNKMAVDEVKQFISLIQTQSPNSQAQAEFAKCATHSFAEASKRLPKALIFLYPKK